MDYAEIQRNGMEVQDTWATCDLLGRSSLQSDSE